MINAIDSLAFSMYSSPGVYALLLGSGISSAAGIKTGWGITMDLISRLATTQGEQTKCSKDPAQWYWDKYQLKPDYSDIIEKLGKSQGDRSQLLKQYFEPTDEEREEGIKAPTKTHKAIAQLVSNGYIKVIVTTNFDRLLEKALEDIGITPDVICNDNQAKGSIPIRHSKCTIIKVNGDYLDTRIRNTEKELSNYEDVISNLLDTVFDEYGLIVCGWSGDWDIALKSVIEKCSNHRYTNYWTHISEPTSKALTLIQLRRSEKIPINDADSFFSELSDKVLSLKEYEQPHPLSPVMLVSMTKKYVSNPGNRIKLHDLVMNETDEVYNYVLNKPSGNNEEDYLNNIKTYEIYSQNIINILINGCYWDNASHQDIWVKSFEKLANIPTSLNYSDDFTKLMLLPALFSFYAIGISSIHTNNFSTYKSVLYDSMLFDNNQHRKPSPILHLFLNNVIVPELLIKHNSKYRTLTPQSDYLLDILYNNFKNIFPIKAKYEYIFDRFEYFNALVFKQYRIKADKETLPIPIGRFGWKRNTDSYSVIKDIHNEICKQQNSWALINLKIFDGDFTNAQTCIQKIETDITKRITE